MELNSKKLEKTSRFIYYSISVILCLFLILLCNKIIDDIDNTSTRPITESFENKVKLSQLNAKEGNLTVQSENLTSQKALIEKTITTAKDNYSNEKQSFDNWVQTRKTLGSPDKDLEVIDRAKKLDEIHKVEESWKIKLDAKQNEIEAVFKQKNTIEKLIENEKNEADSKFTSALKSYDLKVFFVRLLLVAPILGLGIFFFIRYRRHKFWPIFLGFTLFSFYAFFFGLVPYIYQAMVGILDILLGLLFLLDLDITQ